MAQNANALQSDQQKNSHIRIIFTATATAAMAVVVVATTQRSFFLASTILKSAYAPFINERKRMM